MFKRWMKVVLDRGLSFAVPLSEPIDCRRRQLIAPWFGQLESVPEGIACTGCAHTLLLSSELCHVALPKGSGLGANSLGLESGLRK